MRTDEFIGCDMTSMGECASLIGGLGTGPSQRRLLETRAPIREWHRRTTTLFRTLASPGSRGGRLDQTDRRRNADA
jgi:hypothetical protein